MYFVLNSFLIFWREIPINYKMRKEWASSRGNSWVHLNLETKRYVNISTRNILGIMTKIQVTPL